jgi:transcriptional regulator with XRE-family HTH domain
MPADAEYVGTQISYHRKRLGLSQVELAGLINRSESWVSQVERGVRSIDRISVLQKVADALGVSVAELRGAAEPDEDEISTERPEAFESLRLTLTGHPAANAVLGNVPGRLTEQDLSRLRDEYARVWPMVHESRYNDLAPIAAELIPALERAVRANGEADLRRAARTMLTDTYQAVAAMLGKLGESDAAWVSADRATFAAETLNNPLQVAASLFRMAHVFLSLGQVAQVQAVANTAINALGIRDDNSPEALSLRGAFHLVLAISAARDNNRTEAYAQLEHAREIAQEIGGDRNDFGTEFGPTNVALHAVGVAVEVGDAGHALDLSHDVAADRLSPERQARYNLDLAEAHAMRRQIGDALHCLERAEELTPEQTRGHRVARRVARDLLQLSGTRPTPELRALAARFGVEP